MNYFYIALTVFISLCVYEACRFFIFQWLRGRAERRMCETHLGVLNLIASIKQEKQSKTEERAEA